MADCAKAAFVRYYDSVMPLLRTALTSKAEDKQQVLIARYYCARFASLSIPRLCTPAETSLLLLTPYNNDSDDIEHGWHHTCI